MAVQSASSNPAIRMSRVNISLTRGKGLEKAGRITDFPTRCSPSGHLFRAINRVIVPRPSTPDGGNGRGPEMLPGQRVPTTRQYATPRDSAKLLRARESTLTDLLSLRSNRCKTLRGRTWMYFKYKKGLIHV